MQTLNCDYDLAVTICANPYGTPLTIQLAVVRDVALLIALKIAIANTERAIATAKGPYDRKGYQGHLQDLERVLAEVTGTTAPVM
jgi:hypothetical protein